MYRLCLGCYLHDEFGLYGNLYAWKIIFIVWGLIFMVGSIWGIFNSLKRTEHAIERSCEGISLWCMLFALYT